MLCRRLLWVVAFPDQNKFTALRYSCSEIWRSNYDVILYVFLLLNIENVMVNSVDQRVLRWFGHVERLMDEYSVANTVWLRWRRFVDGRCGANRVWLGRMLWMWSWVAEGWRWGLYDSPRRIWTIEDPRGKYSTLHAAALSNSCCRSTTYNILQVQYTQSVAI